MFQMTEKRSVGKITIRYHLSNWILESLDHQVFSKLFLEINLSLHFIIHRYIFWWIWECLKNHLKMQEIYFRYAISLNCNSSTKLSALRNGIKDGTRLSKFLIWWWLCVRIDYVSCVYSLVCLRHSTYSR